MEKTSGRNGRKRAERGRPRNSAKCRKALASTLFGIRYDAIYNRGLPSLSIYPILFAHPTDDPHLSGFLPIFSISCSCQECTTYFDLRFVYFFLCFVPHIVI